MKKIKRPVFFIVIALLFVISSISFAEEGAVDDVLFEEYYDPARVIEFGGGGLGFNVDEIELSRDQADWCGDTWDVEYGTDSYGRTCRYGAGTSEYYSSFKPTVLIKPATFPPNCVVVARACVGYANSTSCIDSSYGPYVSVGSNQTSYSQRVSRVPGLYPRWKIGCYY